MVVENGRMTSTRQSSRWKGPFFGLVALIAEWHLLGVIACVGIVTMLVHHSVRMDYDAGGWRGALFWGLELLNLPLSLLGEGVRAAWELFGITTRMHHYVLPIGVYACADVVVTLLWRRHLRRTRDATRCAHCGYSLVGLPIAQPVCPECGHKVA